MGKISLIIEREYLTRVRKKSFLIMTILGPVLMGALITARIWLALVPEEVQKIQVVDEVNLFNGKLSSAKNLQFYFSPYSLDVARERFYKEDYNVIVYVPENILEARTIQIFYKKQPGYATQEYIRNTIKTQIENRKLIASGIDINQLEAVKTTINIIASKIQETGELEKSNMEMSIAVGFVGGFLIYIFIFLYGAQVMRGIIEEKASRIVEVIISSVKPFQLMMGKIIGIALVGLTQFLLWVILTFGITALAGQLLLKDKYDPATIEQTFKTNAPVNSQKETIVAPGSMGEIKDMLGTINFGVMLGAFLFYFIGGYLLYGALFAAIGAAVDSESDTQQFMLPLTIPLILAFLVSQVIITNPDSPLAFWFSVIPLTSPVVMMVRIPFGVPYYELIISMVMLVVGFIFTTWLAGKIYRTGILMYGKKPSYKEMWKWLFYKA